MKKSKVLIAVLAATMFVLAAFGLVACDKDAGDLGGGTTGGGGGGGGNKTYTITFDADGGTLSGSKTLTTDASGKVTGTTPTATKDGNTFGGWAIAQGTQAAIDFSTKQFLGNQTVYAIWTPVGGTATEYTIEFNYGAGSGTTATAQTVNGRLATLPTPTPPATYTNKGWFTAATGGTEVTTNTVFTQNGTIYAQYTEQSVQPPQPSVKTDGLYDGDTKLDAVISGNIGNEDELMITGLVLASDTDVSIVYNLETMLITPIEEQGTGGDIVSVAADGMSFRLSAGEYTLYYTFQGEKAGKLWAIKEIEGPGVDKNAGFTYETSFTTGPHLVGKFYSRGMNSYSWNDGYLMQGSNGNWTLKNIYLYEGDCMKVRSSGSDGDGTNASISAQIEIYDMSMRIKAGGEGYYTISFNGSTVTVEFHGATPAA